MDFTIVLLPSPKSNVFYIDTQPDFDFGTKVDSALNIYGNNAILRCKPPGFSALTLANAYWSIYISELTIESCEDGITATWSQSPSSTFELQLYSVNFLSIGRFPLSLGSLQDAAIKGSNLILNQCRFVDSNGSMIRVDIVWIVNTEFKSNQGSGSVFEIQIPRYGTSGGSVTITNTTFVDNLSSQYGAPYVYVPKDRMVDVNISNCQFYGNKVASNGGGIFIYALGQVNSFVDSCSFSFNSAEQGGGLAAIAVEDGSITITVSNNDFSDCVASDGGGAIYLSGDVTCSVISTYIGKSQADAGSAIWALCPVIFIKSTWITNNIANISSVYLNVSTATVVDSYISSNAMNLPSYAIQALWNTTMFISGSSINANTIHGGGVGASGFTTYVIVSESFLWGNAGPGLSCQSGAHIDAQNNNSIYRNDYLSLGMKSDASCSSCQVIMSGGLDACFRTCVTDICGVCDGNSLCLSANCNLPYSACAASTNSGSSTTISNQESTVAVNYVGISPRLVDSSQNNTGKQLVFLNIYSLSDKPPNGEPNVYLLGNETFLPSTIYSSALSSAQSAISFHSILSNGAKLLVQQSLFGMPQNVSYAGTQFVVDNSTLKVSLEISDWPNPNDVQLDLRVTCPDTIISVDISSRESILKEYQIATDTTISILSLAEVFVSTNDDGVSKVVSAAINLANSSETDLQFLITFPGPIGTMLYDPDLGALVNTESSSHHADGDDENLLVEILVPTLVGGALLFVCCTVLVLLLAAVVAGRHRRRQMAIREDLVNF
eukprot:TRINITY_DN6015_c0_g1_i1.p1 TRINITY_DN6015_c0_g1~~TRINITY_DN6015_c0_g1_i1.p1  ORF type:complete len:887 (+),score=67.25 TRINITY_DN6015_c0_g1_i1:328-2661(+)